MEMRLENWGYAVREGWVAQESFLAKMGRTNTSAFFSSTSA